jgi:hypothetical protein
MWVSKYNTVNAEYIHVVMHQLPGYAGDRQLVGSCRKTGEEPNIPVKLEAFALYSTSFYSPGRPFMHFP